MNEILTAEEVAALLKISKRQVYELAKDWVGSKDKKRRNDNPIPSVRILTSVRFRKSDIDGWIAGLVKKAA